MQLSNTPGKLLLPFAADGSKNSIPVDSQIGIVAGKASLADGFPPLTRTPLSAGGVPPSGLDMNGILYEMSAVIRWANAGGGYPFDAAFAGDTNVGGYPKGARVLRSDGLGYWFNTVDNQLVDPESAGAAAAGWTPDYTSGVAAVTMTGSNVTLSPLQYGKPIIIISGTLTANLNLIFPNIVHEWVVLNNTTGAFSITCKTAAGTGVVVNTSTLIVGDGTNILATTDSFLQNGSGASKRNIQSRLCEIVSVKDFGAIGNGIADDTSAIQAAITYCGSRAYGGDVFFPSGNYLISGTISVANNFVTLVGAAKDSSVIVRTSAFGVAFRFMTGAAAVLDGCGISSMRMVDNGASNSSGAWVDVDNASRFTVNDVSLFGGTHGVSFYGTSHIEISNCSIYGLGGAPSNRHGLKFDVSTKQASHTVGSNVTLRNVSIFAGDNVSGTVAYLDYGILITAIDGFFANNVYCGGAGVADVDVKFSDATVHCGNIIFSASMLDICRGNGLRIDGTLNVDKIEFSGIVDCNGAGQPTMDGVYIPGPATNIKLSGIFKGWVNNGIHLGATVNGAVVSDSNITNNSGAGIVIDNGANNLIISGNNLAVGNGAPITDNTPSTATKLIDYNLGVNPPWVTYTPAITAGAGTFTSVSAVGRFLKRGSAVNVELTLTITTNGTASGYIIAQAPSLPGVIAGGNFVLNGMNETTNTACVVKAVAGTTLLQILKYDGTYPGANSTVISISGTYQCN